MISPGEPARSRRSLLVLAAVVGLLAGAVVLVVAAAHVTPTGYGRLAPPGVHIGTGPPSPFPTLPKVPGGDPPAEHASDTLNTTAVLAIIGCGLAFFAGALTAIFRVIHFTRRRRYARLADRLGLETGAGTSRRMADAVELGIDELAAERPARNSIIACWQHLRDAAADAGIAPVASDTPEQAVARVLAASGVRAEPLATLAELYREARFSRHVMPDAAVDAARAALDAILADLRQGAGV